MPSHSFMLSVFALMLGAAAVTDFGVALAQDYPTKALRMVLSKYFASMPSALPHMKGGRLLGLAVSGAKRASAAPELPTVAEAGVRDFEVDGWYGVMAPAGTDAARINRIVSVVHEALEEPELREQFRREGIDVVYSSPEQFSSYIKREIGKWSRIIRASSIKAEM